jgi:predicted NAD/FAD-dependent oxidoreductase
MIDVAIVGAGVAGLSCARALVRAGRSVRLLERSLGVGGRCATRRVEGQPVDHGVVFLHGATPDFLAALDAVDDEPLEGWPGVIRGVGTPCQPRAFSPLERRVAFRGGVNAFPKQLARGLELTRDVNVTRIVPVDGAFTLHGDSRGEVVEVTARDVVLALAGAQSAELLAGLPPSRERDSALATFGMLPSLPCATVIAVYDRGVSLPEFDMWFPERSEILQLVAHDSNKRRDPVYEVLVLQARPQWSRANLTGPEGDWAALMLRDAARLLGHGVERPRAVQPHRWAYARTANENELALPFVLHWEGSGRIGVAGELCAPGGGVQAAFNSGMRLAQRLASES